MARTATQPKTEETQVAASTADTNVTNDAGASTTETPVANPIDSVDLTQFNGNKSACMRHLASLGYKTGPIAKELTRRFYTVPGVTGEIKYQFVRNVLATKTSAA